MKYISETVKVIVLTLVIIFSAGIVNAWTGPTATPPLNNVAAPINVSTATQEKMGIFGSHGFFSLGSGWFSTSTRANWPPAKLTLGVNGAIGAKEYCDDNGQNCVKLPATGGSGMCSAADMYDSGWVSTNGAGEKIFTHNLNEDAIVFIEKKPTANTGGFPNVEANKATNYGTYWYNLTPSTITVYTTSASSYRVVMWKKGCGASGAVSQTGMGTPDYDSGWIDYGLSGNVSKKYTHNLGTENYFVEVEGRGGPTGGTGTNCPRDAITDGDVNAWFWGAYAFWYDKTPNSISFRASQSSMSMCDRHYRIKLWKYTPGSIAPASTVTNI